MQRYFSQLSQTPSQRSTRSTVASIATPKSSPTGHYAASRRAEKARRNPKPSSSPNPSEHIETKEFPDDARLNSGVLFPINWDNIWLGNRKLPASKLSYRVRLLSQVSGNRRLSPIWKYGADLVFLDEGSSVSTQKIWLC